MKRSPQDPLYWIERETPTVFAVARAICEGHGSNPDRRVLYEGPAPIWTDQVRPAKAALERTAIMLRANGFLDAAQFLDKEASRTPPPRAGSIDPDEPMFPLPKMDYDLREGESDVHPSGGGQRMSGVAYDPRSPSQLRDAGCTCEFGCRSCGMSERQMGNCPGWDPCPMGRATSESCPLHAQPSGQEER